jgi:hypothetical protein
VLSLTAGSTVSDLKEYLIITKKKLSLMALFNGI